MPQSLVKIYIHAVWSTKYRAPLIIPKNESTLYRFMKEQFEKLSCPAMLINGMPDHVHCLIRLHQNIALASVLKQVKGSSSFYMNETKMMDKPFNWQNGYGAFSVSQSEVQTVYNYIWNQKRHHLGESFTDEFNRLTTPDTF